MKKIIFVLIVIFALTGCNSYTELNDLSIVNTLGITYSNNTYTIKLSILTNNNNNEDNIEVFTAKNNNLNSALEDIYLTSNKRLYLSHLDLVILDDDSINYKLKEILDNFIKNNEYRNNFQVIIMDSNDLEKFFDKKIKAEYVNNLVKTNNLETGIVFKKELEEFLNDILIDNNSYLPTFSFNKDTLTLNGYTLIKNKKIYKRLDQNESIILNLLNNKINKTYINNINIFENNTSIKTNKNKIDFDLNMIINETDDVNIKNLKDRLLSFLKYYQNQDYDILKLCELIRKNHYHYYKKNTDLLKKIDFNINIKTDYQKDYIKGGL